MNPWLPIDSSFFNLFFLIQITNIYIFINTPSAVQIFLLLRCQNINLFT